MSLATRQAWQARLFGGGTELIARRQNRHAEQGVLNAVLKVLRLHPKVSWVVRMNSGAYKMPDGRFVRFGFPGCPDVLGQMRDGRLLAIEVKAAKGRLTDEQEFVLAKVRANNGVSGVARSIEDAVEIVEGGA
jgi:VRR-NUC domain